MEQSIIDLLSADKVIGLRQVNRGIGDDAIRCVLIAADTEERIRRELTALCRLRGVPVRFVSSKEELGKAVGIDVDCATVGILKARSAVSANGLSTETK